MLSDKLRSLTYLKAMQDHVHLFKDKVVMDIGAGSGIWACTAARLGAKRVYAVEAGGMASLAERIAAQNGFTQLSVLHSRVEDLIASGAKDPQTGEPIVVDTIISEWMGYWLLTEGVLSSVFHARDAWLRKDTGVIFPSHCCMYIAPFTDRTHRHFWDDVYGIKMSSVAAHIGERDDTRHNPSLEDTTAECLLSEPCMCHWVDCVRDTNPHIEVFSDSFRCQVTKKGSWDGFVGFFSVYFDPGCAGQNPKKSPEDVMQDKSIGALHTIPTNSKNFDTHWHHTVLQLPSEGVEEGDVIEGKLDWAPNTHEPRYFDADITWTKVSSSGARSDTRKRQWYKC
eukprot:151945_1